MMTCLLATATVLCEMQDERAAIASAIYESRVGVDKLSFQYVFSYSMAAQIGVVSITDSETPKCVIRGMTFFTDGSFAQLGSSDSSEGDAMTSESMEIKVCLSNGDMFVSWPNQRKHVFAQGPHVFAGDDGTLMSHVRADLSLYVTGLVPNAWKWNAGGHDKQPFDIATIVKSERYALDSNHESDSVAFSASPGDRIVISRSRGWSIVERHSVNDAGDGFRMTTHSWKTIGKLTIPDDVTIVHSTGGGKSATVVRGRLRKIDEVNEPTARGLVKPVSGSLLYQVDRKVLIQTSPGGFDFMEQQCEQLRLRVRERPVGDRLLAFPLSCAFGIGAACVITIMRMHRRLQSHG